MTFTRAPLLALALALAAPALAGGDRDDEEPDLAPTRIQFDMVEISGQLGATPGGAQDSAHFADQVDRGVVPPQSALTAEGLLSEHDLPLSSSTPCERLLCTEARAVPVALPSAEQTQALLQLGFSSSLTAETFERPPLNLVAVVDRSCSMSGPPIDTVRASLHAITDKLGPGDQLSIVTYGSSVDVELPPTAASDSAALHASIDSLAIQGSTNMEAGLVEGFGLARQTRRPFDGVTRVMLFTDERPNTGRTDADSFMGLARAASADGIGLTTFGFGAHFGNELATRISAVRGGNLFFFPDAPKMREAIDERFEFMVTELAYDMELVVRPVGRARISGLYGLPGELVRWHDDGSLRMRVETLFLSDKKGAIYLGFSSTPRRGPLARVELSYTPRDGAASRSVSDVQVDAAAPGDTGLIRGPHLIDAYTTVQTALGQWHDQAEHAGAAAMLRALADRLRRAEDRSLDPLISSVDRLARNMGANADSPAPSTRRDRISGLPLR